jgi:general secretion pathway protein G
MVATTPSPTFASARPAQPVRSGQQGFTLMELMIVMIIIGVLAAIAVPAYIQSVRHAREAVLKEDLHTLRAAIDSYTVDQGKAPQALTDLVDAGYLKSMPKDPMTNSTDTWVPAESDLLSTADQTESGINDVHSGSQDTGSDGTAYNTW